MQKIKKWVHREVKTPGCRARDAKGLVLSASRPFVLTGPASRKNRSEAEPGAARPGAQNKAIGIIPTALTSARQFIKRSRFA